MVGKWLIIICSTVLLAGCKTEPERWVPTRTTDIEAAQALTECKNANSPGPVPFTEPTYLLPDAHAIAQCMEAKGFTRATDGSQGPQSNARAIDEAQLYLLQ